MPCSVNTTQRTPIHFKKKETEKGRKRRRQKERRRQTDRQRVTETESRKVLE